MSSEIDELLENEWYIVRHSGETPEIAYHSALYFLTRSKQGPGLTLTTEQIGDLQNAAMDRYREIVLRDLDHTNVDTSIYRGVARSICNYRRFCTFCKRQHLDPSEVHHLAADALKRFLSLECKRYRPGTVSQSLNCTFEELRGFAKQLEVEFCTEFFALRSVCLVHN